MRRLTITFDVAFGKDEPEPEEHDTDLAATTERAGHNEPDERAELDQRRAIGFRHEETT